MFNFVLDPSHYHYNIHAVFPLIISLFVAITCLIVSYREMHSQMTIHYVIFSTVIMTWMFGIAMAHFSVAPDIARWWITLGNLGVSLIPAAMTKIAVIITDNNKKYFKLIAFLWFHSAIIFLINLFTDWYIAGIIRHWWGYYGLYGPVGIYASITTVASLSFCIYLYADFRRSPHANSDALHRSKLMLVGHAIATIALVDYLATFGFAVYPIGFFAVFILFSIFTYVTWRYRIFDFSTAFNVNTVLQTMSDAIVALDRHGGIKLANSATNTLFPNIARPALGLYLFRLVTGLEHVKTKTEHGYDTIYETDLEGLCSATEQNVYHLTASRILDNDGEAQGYLCVVRDISERRRAEESIRQARDEFEQRFIDRSQELAKQVNKLMETDAALRESEDRWQFALEGSGDGVWDWNLVNNKVFYSKQWLRMLAIENADETLTIAELKDRIHPDDHAQFEKQLSSHLSGSTPFFLMEHRIRKNTGYYPWVLNRAKAVARDASGNATRIIGTLTDITDQKIAQLELINEKETAEKASRAKSEFLSRMSHELRTPLNAILGFSELLRRDDTNDNLDDEQRKQIGVIHDAGQHLYDIINEMLDLTTIEAGKVKIVKSAVDISTTIENCLPFLDVLAREKNVSIRVEKSPVPLFVSADDVRLRQIILNFISNAIKYNRPNGEIAINLAACENVVRINISDTGVGMSAQQIANLYEPFNRLGAENTHVDGLGIGLTISKRLIELMGGRVGVESVPGSGSTFWFELQNANEQCGNHNSPTRESSKLLTTINTRNANILYVEDNEVNRILVAGLITKKTNYTVTTVETPNEGIDVCRARTFELILLDINLPGMSGYDLIVKLREIHQPSNVPIIAISANALADDIERALKCGFDDYITKPINIMEFYPLLLRYLEPTSEYQAVNKPL